MSKQFEDKYHLKPGEFKGHPFVSIYEKDQNGVLYPKPLLSLGKKKIEILEYFLEDLKQLTGITPSRPISHMDVNVEEDVPF